ncbi:MAG: hypothetical protein AB7N76_11100 [Planctomycetota bacterium]
MSSEQGEALRQGARDGALLGVGALASAGLGLVSLRLLVTGLSPADYGRYALFLTLGGLLGLPLLWPTHAVLRLGSEEAERGGRGAETLGSVGAVVLAALLAVSLALVAAQALLPEAALAWLEVRLVARELWPLALLFAALSAGANLGYTLLQPFGRNHLRTLLPALPRLLYAAALLWAVASGAGLDLPRAAWLATLTIAPVLVVAPLLVRPGLPRPRAHGARRAVDFGAPLLLRNLGVAGVLYVDLLVLKAFLGDAAVGRYQVAYAVGEQVVAFGFVLTFLAGPALARAAVRGEVEPLRRFYQLVAPPLVWLWCLGAGLGIVLARPLLALLGGGAESAAVLEVLMLAVAIRGAAVLEIAVFEAHLLSRWPTAFFALGFLLNLGLDVALLRAGWGLTAPALATVAGFLLQAALRAGYARRRFDVPAFRPYLALAPVALVLAAQRAGGWPAGALAWALVVAGTLTLGRRTRLFSRDAQPALAEVRMPAALRRFAVWLHAGPAHAGPAHPGPAHPGPARPGPAHPDPAHPCPAQPDPVHPTPPSAAEGP